MNPERKEKLEKEFYKIYDTGYASDCWSYFLSILDKELEEERNRIVERIEKIKSTGIDVVDYKVVLDLIHNKS